MSKSWSEKNRSQNIQDYKAKEENFASRNANGTGPYKLISWQPDQAVKMVANKDWWDKNPGNVTELSYLPIKSAPTRVASSDAAQWSAIMQSNSRHLRRALRDETRELVS